MYCNIFLSLIKLPYCKQVGPQYFSLSFPILLLLLAAYRQPRQDMRASLSIHHASPQCQGSPPLTDPFTDLPLLRSNHRITSRHTARPYLVIHPRSPFTFSPHSSFHLRGLCDHSQVAMTILHIHYIPILHEVILKLFT